MVAEAAAKRVTRRRVRTRAKLLDAAFAVFAAKGFGRVSIEEVCEAAGYSRGAFYSNFGSLDELFFALYRDRAELIADQVAGALALDGPASTCPPPWTASPTCCSSTGTGCWSRPTSWCTRPGTRPLPRPCSTTGPGCAAPSPSDSPRARGHTRLPAVLGDIDGAARAVIAAYDGVTTQLLLDKDAERARSWLRQLLTALLTDSGNTP